MHIIITIIVNRIFREFVACLTGLLPELIFPQNLPSVVVGHVLNPQPGECVLDMCASPGGKTTHIASLMRNQVRRQLEFNAMHIL